MISGSDSSSRGDVITLIEADGFDFFLDDSSNEIQLRTGWKSADFESNQQISVSVNITSRSAAEQASVMQIFQVTFNINLIPIP